MRTFFFFAGEGWSSLRRSPAASVAAVSAIAAVLFVLLLLLLLSHNILVLSERLGERKGLSVFLAAGTTAERISELEHHFSGFDEIAGVRLVSKEKALSDVEEDLDIAELSELLGENPLPDVFLITPQASHSDAAALAELAAEIEAYPDVDDVLYGERWIAALDQGLRTVRRADALTGGLATLAIILVLGNTLRLLVLMREEQLTIMKVIGATDAFVRAPFVTAGVLLCLIGGVFALGLLRVAFAASAGLLPGLHFLPLPLMLVFLLGVAAVGVLGSLMTVEASVRQIERRSRRLRA